MHRLYWAHISYYLTLYANMRLRESFSVSQTVAKIMVNRGVSGIEQAKAFMESDTKFLRDPFLLPDMYKAVARIRKAVDSKEKILIYGDRDVTPLLGELHRDTDEVGYHLAHASGVADDTSHGLTIPLQLD